MRRHDICNLIVLVMLASAITGLLAAVGEPQSAWLVCDVLNLEVCK